MTQVAVTTAVDDDARKRRRGTSPTPASVAVPAPPAVEPVAGTASAITAQQVRAVQAAAPPHLLEQPDHVLPPQDARRGLPPGMTPVEAADRIAAAVLQAGTGPILLLVPGTLGTEYQTSMLALGRATLRAAAGSVQRPSIASIPYPNGVLDIFTRVLRIGVQPSSNVLSLVLHRLARVAKDRPILLAGESQGAWLIADTLRMEPELAALVSRVAMFAKPGIAASPGPIGSATGQQSVGIQEWAHVDDIVPHIPAVFTGPVIGGFVDAIKGLLATGSYHYTPHHYDRYGAMAAQWLLDGTVPPVTKLKSTDPLPAAPSPTS